MTEDLWTDVDRYFADVLVPPDDALDAALRAGEEAGMPPQAVSPVQGRLLTVLAHAIGARRILEIGTLAGYSTICLARALPAGGRLVTLEADPRHAEVAAADVARAGLGHAVDIRVGPALETLPGLAAEGGDPFDLVFIDADKESNPGYLDWTLRLTRRGSLIVGDNVVRGGEVIDPASRAGDVVGTRRFLELLGQDPRLCATALQTVGAKGWDGFAIAVVTADP